MGRPHHARTAVAVLALGLAGCADVDFTLNEDGSGTFNVTFNAPSGGNFNGLPSISVPTNASGIATANYTTANVAGTQSVTATVGGVRSGTVTVTAGAVVLLPAASRATAVSTCAPGVAAVASQEIE